MKKATIFLITVLALGVIFSGCKKDNETPKNQMTYDGVEYDLSHGLIYTYSEVRNVVYDYDIVLLSPGFILHDNDSISGIGNGIMFELYSSNSNIPDNGDYTYDDSGDDNVGTCGYSDAAFNYNIQTEEGTDVEANGGKVTVKVSGNEYEISIALTMVGGKPLTGFYKGTLKLINVNTKSVSRF